MRICVIIPAYNAGETINEALERVRKTNNTADIIVVDDGSNDDTAEKAKAFGAVVLTHPRNFGKGAALKTAFEYCLKNGYDVFVTLDADLQHPPEMINDFIAKIESGYDLVVGNRLYNTDGMPFERKISNACSTFIVSLMSGIKVEDSQCGYRAIKRWILERATLLSRKYEIESELIVEAARMGAKIAFIKIPTIYRGKSYFHPIVDTLRFLWFVLTYFPKRWFLK